MNNKEFVGEEEVEQSNKMKARRRWTRRWNSIRCSWVYESTTVASCKWNVKMRGFYLWELKQLFAAGQYKTAAYMNLIAAGNIKPQHITNLFVAGIKKPQHLIFIFFPNCFMLFNVAFAKNRSKCHPIDTFFSTSVTFLYKIVTFTIKCFWLNRDNRFFFVLLKSRV